MAIEVILNAMRGVRKKGQGRYVALCPVHTEKTPSCALTETSDGTVLVHCFGCGAGAIEIVNALGVDESELFLYRDKIEYGQKKPPLAFSDRQLLSCIEFEASIVAIAAHDIINGIALTKSESERVGLAYRRIGTAVNYQRKLEHDWNNNAAKHDNVRSQIKDIKEGWML